MRILIFLFIFIIAQFNNPSYAYNPKSSSIIIDADNGNILYESKGYQARYPASLTKMMTLYILFDALRLKKIYLNNRMKVSKKAAKQPQTNISLKEGDRIRVSDAIAALIVRSANDVAVVVAERLGGTEKEFAKMMTKKARQLKMNMTFFKNPHGLPDEDQITTAYDMALLGIALRRDFPQYYHYFSMTEFTYNGKKYKGHNKVLGHLDGIDGIDGIKTGYTHASGFNLVSSVKKNGYNIIAVVMGEKSSIIRNNKMITLLEKTFNKFANKQDKTRIFTKAPTPILNPIRYEKEILIAKSDEIKSKAELTKIAKIHNMNIEQENNNKDILSMSWNDNSYDATNNNKISPASFDINLKDVAMATTFNINFNEYSNNHNKYNKNIPFRTASYTKFLPENNYIKDEWGIQVGAFIKEKDAMKAISQAFTVAKKELSDGYVSINKWKNKGKIYHRARIGNLSKKQAKSICAKLHGADKSCFPIIIN